MMTIVSQRVAIAGACGWKDLQDLTLEDTKVLIGRRIDQRSSNRIVVPNYPNDLNAMHEAEKTLSITQRDLYINILNKVCNHDYVVSASAFKRAEAFLKTIGKWNDAT